MHEILQSNAFAILSQLQERCKKWREREDGQHWAEDHRLLLPNMSSFFTLPASQRKRKRTDANAARPVKKRSLDGGSGTTPATNGAVRNQRRGERDDSISGSDTEEDVSILGSEGSRSDVDEGETAEEKRLRLAQRYLDNIREDVAETGFDAADVDRDLIAQRLRQDADEAKGRQYRLIAQSLESSQASRTSFRADTQSTTAVAICAPYVYTVSKDKALIKWQLASPVLTAGQPNSASTRRQKPKQLNFVRGVRIDASASQQHGHTSAILSVAASPDGKYIATGGADRKLIIWAAETLKPLKTFNSHRDSVTSLSFAPSSSQPGVGAQLFSASMDRTLKTFSLNGDDSLAYVETLFGHQDHVLAVAAMTQDQCVSVGARDRTARLWKVVDETQLVFRGDSSKKDPHTVGSMDCVAAIPPAHFVTGSDAGTISLWSMHKKKPLFTVHAAHGVDEPEPFENVTSEMDPEVIAEHKKGDTRQSIARPITALASVPGTDLVLSGSWDGCVRLWKVSDDKQHLMQCGTLGTPAEQESTATLAITPTEAMMETPSPSEEGSSNPINGIINSIAVLERRKQVQNEFGGKKEGDTLGICVVVGTGKELRLGRWKKIAKGKNGAVLFEVPARSSTSS